MEVVSPHLSNVWYKGIEEENCMCFCYGEAVNDRIQFWGKMSNFFRLLKYDVNDCYIVSLGHLIIMHRW